MATQVPPIRAAVYYFTISLTSQTDTNIFQVNPTLAAGDVLVYKDSALDGNIDTLPVAIGASCVLACTLSIDEMTADRVAVLFHDVAGAEWQDLLVMIDTVAISQIDDLATAVALAVAQTDLDTPAQYQADVSNLDVAVSSRAVAGDEMALIDDAITSDKFDESTAFPLKATDSGVTYLARTGADSDTLETLSDQLDTAQTDLDTPAQYQADVSNLDVAVSTRAVAGDEMDLIDDAITNDKFDESTAFPLAAVDAGATEVARVGADSDTLETLSDQIDGVDADVWAYATRTLTQAAATVAAVVAGDDITAVRGDSFSASLTGLGDISTRDKLWFTVKADKSDADTASIIQIEETAGLVYFNGAVAAVSANGTITVTDQVAGDLTIAIDKEEMDDLAPTPGLQYDIQMLTAAGTVTTLTNGLFATDADVTRAIA